MVLHDLVLSNYSDQTDEQLRAACPAGIERTVVPKGE